MLFFSCEANHPNRDEADNTDAGQHQNKYNVVRVGSPECKQVQRLVTVVSALWICVVRLVVSINPHVSVDETSEDERLHH